MIYTLNAVGANTRINFLYITFLKFAFAKMSSKEIADNNIVGEV